MDSYEKQELLTYLIDGNMIDLDEVHIEYEMSKRNEILEKHKYEIWQGKDNKWYTYVPDKERGRVLKKRNTEEELQEAIYLFYKKQEDEPTIEVVFNLWLDEKLEYKEIKKQTYDKYKTDYARFFVNNKELGNFHQRKIRYINEEDLERFIKTTIVKLALTQKAYSGMRTLINGIFKYAKRKRYTNLSITNFFGDLDLSRKSFKRNVKNKEDEVYQEAEAERLTQYLASQPDDIRCLGLLLIFESGLRIGELSGLKLEDIGEKFIHIMRTEVKYKNASDKWVLEVQDIPKSEAGDRFVILNDGAKRTLDNILNIREVGEFLFMENGKRIRSNGFRRKLERVCNQLGIKYKSNHKIRKTYGTLLIDGGVDDSLVAEQMGHRDVITTKKYYYYSNKNEESKRIQINKAVVY